MEEVGFEEIGAYILKRQKTVTQYISTWTVLCLCERTTWRPGAWVARICWEQEEIDLAGKRERTAEAADVDEDRGGEETAR